MSFFSKSKIDSIADDVHKMKIEEKAALIDEIYVKQPNILALVLAQTRMGVSVEKIDFSLDVLVICHLLSKNVTSGWAPATEEEIDKQIGRHTALVKFWDGLGDVQLEETAIREYVKSHPEPELFVFGTQKVREWLRKVRAEENDKYVMMAVMCMINCLAYGVRASAPNHSLQGRRS